MRFLWMLIIILHGTNAANNDSTSTYYLDPTDPEDNVFLWKNLFIKLNTLLSETEKLGQGLVDVNKRLDDLSKRQEDQENHLTKLTEHVKEIGLNAQKRQQDQKNLLPWIMEIVNASRVDNKISHEWTTILRRQDGLVDFFRNWAEYKNGFGNPDGDFFIGLERLHAMTTYGSPQELLIVLVDFENQTRYANYDLFRIGNEAEKYAIKELGSYSGDAGDGMKWHKAKMFSTFDQNNNIGGATTCPDTYKGAWWFHKPCYSSHLNGPYRQKSEANTWGVSWHPWREWNYSLKYAAMMIRPKF